MRTLLILSLLIAGCAPSVPIPSETGKQGKDCLPDAIEMVQGLQKAGIKAEVIRMSFCNTKIGHAIAAYIYPVGSNKLWVWDAENGSFQVHALFGDPLTIAQKYAFTTASDEVIEAEILTF